MQAWVNAKPGRLLQVVLHGDNGVCPVPVHVVGFEEGSGEPVCVGGENLDEALVRFFLKLLELEREAVESLAAIGVRVEIEVDGKLVSRLPKEERVWS